MSDEAGALRDRTTAFREEYRAKEIGPRYSGWLHFATTTTGSFAAIAFAAWHVRGPSALAWLTVPLTFLFANVVEFLGHRGPMHHRRPALDILFRRHTLEHHRFFTHEAMSYESSRDFKMVLFPPVMLLFFLGGVASPIAALLFLVASPAVAWLFVATAVGYFLAYEWLHFAHHLPERSLVARTPLLRALRRHHQAHHHPRFMSTCNFNVSFPIADRLFGTMAPPEAQGLREGPRAGEP